MSPLPNNLLWIPDLVRGVFFAPCDRHSAGSKGEQVNLFAVGRRRAMCPACAAESSVSDAIQVRQSAIDAMGGFFSYVRSVETESPDVASDVATGVHPSTRARIPFTDSWRL